MALNTSKCNHLMPYNHLMPLHFKGLSHISKNEFLHQDFSQSGYEVSTGDEQMLSSS